ncbi:MAG: hypothetical protein ABI378_09280 [Chitinophagaceae bacterium]
MKFSERLGYKPVKDQLQIASVDEVLRNLLWSAYLESFLEKLDDWHAQPSLTRYARALWDGFFKMPIDSLPKNDYNLVDPIWVTKYLRKYFFSDDREWFDFYDLFEFSAPFAPFEFLEETNLVLGNEKSAFRFVNQKFVQITSKIEIAEIEEAIASTDKYNSVNTHLNEALKMLADKELPNYRNSIKESISAVESICRIFTDNPKSTLGEALLKLEKTNGLHPALKKSFSSLYGYASDESGIRHALMEDSRDIDFHEAKLMLVTCSAFINYLKSRQK